MNNYTSTPFAGRPYHKKADAVIYAARFQKEMQVAEEAG